MVLCTPSPCNTAESEPSTAGDVHRPIAGHVYLDGSGFDCERPWLARCGWSAVVLHGDGGHFAAWYGPLAGERQTVPRAELKAIEASTSTMYAQLQHGMRVGMLLAWLVATTIMTLTRGGWSMPPVPSARAPRSGETHMF